MSDRLRPSVAGYWLFVATILFLFCVVSRAASAQTPPSAQTPTPTRTVFRPPPRSKWEASFYAGSMNAGIPLQGIPDLPTQPPLFGTVNGKLSRPMPTWFFGWGADFFQQIATQAQIPQRIATLDNIVFLPSSQRGNSWAMGGRISRVMNPRASLEGSFEFSRAQIQLADNVRPAVEAARASFPTAWTALFATDPATFQNVDVTAASTVSDGDMTQMTAEGALIINILTRRRNTPYVGMGVGMVRHSGDSPSVTLTGRTRMMLNGSAPIDELDTLTLGYALDRTVVAASIRLGIKRMMGERWGVQGEMREQLTSNPLTHTITATPSRVLTNTASQQGAAATPAFVSVQFSNMSTTASTLSGSLTEFRAFGGSGMESRLSFTGGIFWRF